MQQVLDPIQSNLYDAEMKIYEIKMNQLNNMLLQRLIKAHPFSSGMTPQEFLTKYVVKNPTVTPAEIQQFIAANKIPAKDINDELKKKIHKYILEEKARVAVAKWFAVQRKEHGVVINLRKPGRPKVSIPVGDAPTMGPEDAKVTIIEYSDFQCPYCAKAESTVKRIQKNYAGKIRLVYKNFPLGFHNEAFVSAEAGFCAHEQSNDFFWKLHDKMLADPRGLKREGLKQKATELGLDVNRFEKCLDDKKYFSRVNRDIAEGTKFGVNSTPIFFVNGVVVKGAKSYEEFAKIIDEELAD